MDSKGILLESGTNELEVIVFEVGGNSFGINVLKVREIMEPIPVTKTPKSHDCVEGIVQIRDEIMPVIDLAKVLDYPSSATPEKDKLIIAELNQMKVVFHVHSVSKIHRISWENIEKPTNLVQTEHSATIGVIKMDGKLILLLDFEKIVVDVNPDAGINVSQVKKMGIRERSAKRIVVAEDSPLLRKLLEETLTEAGYTNLRFFENGKEAYDNLSSTSPDLVITDIEMPQMDGHHLTKLIKTSTEFSKVPVVVFSSLITDDLYHKGEKVGADAQISKPEIVQLIGKIDELTKD